MPPRRWQRNLLVGFGSFVAVLALAAGMVLVIAGDDAAQALEVTLQPLDDEGPDPFTASVVTVDTAVAKQFARDQRERSTTPAASTPGGPSTAAQTTDGEAEGEGEADTTDGGGEGAGGWTTQSVAGDSSGLYGVDSAAPVCDQDRLVELISADPDTAATWADAMGIDAGVIPETVSGFTPVLLARDTAVTNHSFSDGSSTAFQAVLQAGTSVLIDDRGTPRVQCICGNPLTGPTVGSGTDSGTASADDSTPDSDTGDVIFVGDAWDGFDEEAVTGITPTRDPVTSIEATEVSTGEATTVEVGATVSLDGFLVSDDTGVWVVSRDGETRTQVIDHPVAVAFDDGAGGIVYQELHTGDLLDSVSSESRVPDRSPSIVRQRRPVDADEAAVWHLPAGGDEAVAIIEPDDWRTSWPMLGGVGRVRGTSVVAYSPVRPDADTTDGQQILDLATGESTRTADFLNEPAADEPHIDFLGETPVLWFPGDGRWSFHRVESDGSKGTPYCDPTWNDCSRVVGELPDGRLLTVEENWNDYTGALATVDPQTSARITAIPDSTFPLCADICNWSGATMDTVGTELVSSHFRYDDGSTSAPAKLFDLETGASALLDIDGVIRILRSPIIRPAPNGVPPTD